jgi:ornithine cyclodeaminase/alanine dehydrogenase-like protein (mu-crystallin family)
VETRLLYLSDADIRTADVTTAQLLATLETAFREKGEGRVEVPPKGGIHPAKDAFIHAMPAYLPASRAAGLKWMSAFPENGGRGLPNVSGLIILNDADTGFPLSVMDAQWITAKRTGAATALSARCLARQDSKTVGVLGCGVQARTNLEALLQLFPLRKLFAYDRHFERADAYAREMRAQFSIDATAVRVPRAAVTDMDIVVTAGAISKVPHATIQAGWLKRGAFASLVDFDAYWSPEALREVDKFCTDDTAQLEHFRQAGYFEHVPPIHADLGELLTAKKPGRASPQERTVACNLGLALEDVATAAVVYQRAVARGLGTWLPR